MRALARRYNKLCDLPDFDDPALRAKLREIVGPGYEPEAELHRKFWEYAMLGLYLEEVGALREDASALAVAAGHEEPLYWLANRIGRVVAIDTYGEGAFAVDGREADATMLTAPERFAPYPYRTERLEVRSMNALDLQFDDASFDIVFSLSSIEHFGEPADIRRAAAEMARVLRPGGHLVIVTEVFVRFHPLDVRPVQVAIRVLTRGRRCRRSTLRKRVIDGFRPYDLRRDVIRPTGLPLVQPLDMTVSPETRDHVTHWVGDGSELRAATRRSYPHILLKAHGSPWTSAFLALHKPG